METAERFQLADADLMTLFKRDGASARRLPFATDDENMVIATTYWGMRGNG